MGYPLGEWSVTRIPKKGFRALPSPRNPRMTKDLSVVRKIVLLGHEQNLISTVTNMKYNNQTKESNSNNCVFCDDCPWILPETKEQIFEFLRQ